MSLYKEMDIYIKETRLGEEHRKNVNALIGGITSGTVPPDALRAVQEALDP